LILKHDYLNQINRNVNLALKDNGFKKGAESPGGFGSKDDFCLRISVGAAAGRHFAKRGAWGLWGACDFS